MATDFFQQLSALSSSPTCDWVIAVRPIDSGRLAISVLYRDRGCGDPAAKTIPPLIFNEQPEVIDKSFFADLQLATGQTITAYSSMEQYLKEVETAKKNSVGAKDKNNKQDKAKTDREKKYEAKMKQADELEALGKFRDAWVKVPEIDEYPEKEAEIRARRAELSAQFEPDLFTS